MTRDIIILALVSSISRALINVIDRHLFGNLKKNIVTTSFINNILPLSILLPISFYSGSKDVLLYLFDSRVIVFSLLVQVVAFSFSSAFKHFEVQNIIILSKTPDLFIPILLFIATGFWSFNDFIFSLLTSLVCIPILFVSFKNKKYIIGNTHIILFVIISLIIQGTFSSTLVNNILSGSIPGNILGILYFTTGVIFWRTFISMLISINIFSRNENILSEVFNPLLLLRSGLTILTQFTFIHAISYYNSTVAWPILNSTILFSLFFSHVFLNEKTGKMEVLVTVTIFILVFIRFMLDGIP